MNDTLELTVLIPTLNEGAHLAQVLAGVRTAVGELTSAFEILIVDGGSRDATVAAAETAGARVVRQRGRGFGAAIREGLQLAQGRWVLTMDADGSHPARYFQGLWARRENSDLVIASRFVPGGGADMPWHRYILSRLLNAASRRVLDFPIRDSSSGLRLYRREAMLGLPLAAEDFSIQQEALAHLLANQGRAEEIPFFYEPRLGGQSKADIWLLARRYLRMLWTLKKIRGGRAEWTALTSVLVLGLGLGLWGLGWGLPGAGRLRALADGRPTPAVAQELEDRWSALYADLRRSHEEMRREEPVTRLQGFQEIAPGWTSPPQPLINSYRSFLLQADNPDEKKSFIILSQMRPWKLEFQPLYIQYGGAFIYPLGAFLKALSWLHAVTLVPELRHYLQQPEDMRRLYLAGRVFILLFHLGSLALLFNLGRRLSGWRTGLAAAAFWTLCPIAVINGHTIKPHDYSVFWVLAAARLMLSAYDEGTRKRYLWCGACAGLALGANFTLGALLILPLLAWAGRKLETRAASGEGAWALAGIATSAAVCLALNPYLAISPRAYAWETTIYGIPPSLKMAMTGLPLMLANSIPGVGLFLCALALTGAITALARTGPKRLLALALWLTTATLCWRFAGLMADRTILRLYLPMLALGILLGADFIADLARPRFWKAAILAALLMENGWRALVILDNAQRAAGADATRAQAADWIEAHIPAGSSVGLLRYPEPAHTPPFRFNRYRLVLFDSPTCLPAGREPDFIVADEMIRGAMENWLGKDYDQIQAFQPWRALWADRSMEDYGINNGMFVYRRRGAKI